MEAIDVDATIGNYRLLGKLGEGGMGTVFLAEHTLLRRRAALKVLHPMFTRRDDIVERFFNEARAATTIADPGIIQVFDFGYHDDTAFIVMELLEGESLDARLRRLGHLPAMDVLRLIRQLALSLFAAHQRGVIHRDLKPENIFIVPDLEVFGGERTKILDFGIAKLSDGEISRMRTQTGLMMGTPVYMSPEQCRGAGSIDSRADIYSLGCVMFHLLTGRPPFDNEGGGELIAAHLKELAPAPSEFVAVSPAIDVIVARCLAKEPQDRYSNMHALALDLDLTLRAGTIPPLGPDPARLTPIPSASTLVAVDRPRPRWLIAFAIAAVVGLGGATAAAVAIRISGSSSSTPPPSLPPPTPISTTKPGPASVPPISSKPIPTVEERASTPSVLVAPTPVAPTPPTSKPAAVIHRRPVLPSRPAPKQDAGSASGSAAPPPPPADPYDDR